ncbi:MAG: YceI family protein [Chitinophagales bacterium]
MKTQLFFTAVVCLLLAAGSKAQAQNKYYDKNCDVSFFSSTPIEDIQAKNSSSVSVIDIGSGAMEFSSLVKAFEFPKALMQEHFNENYMESEKFPKASFKGNIKNISDVNFKADGSYPVTVMGTLTIHGVSREVTTTGTIHVKGSSIQALSAFAVNPEDYNIDIPGVVKEKIAKEIQVKVDANYQPYVN